MHWYQPLDQRILAWRHWRQSLPQELEPCLLEIQRWWCASPWRKVSKLSDDISQWPTPWTLFDNMSYCDGMRALGMFYTLCLIPHLRALGPEIWVMYTPDGERAVIAVLDQKKYVLNFDPRSVVNIQNLPGEFQQVLKYHPRDFKTLE